MNHSVRNFLFIYIIIFCLKYRYVVTDQCPPAYSTCNLGIDGYTNVHLVAHTHDDVGWKSTVDEFYYGKQTHGVQYILGINNLIAKISATKNFSMSCSCKAC